MEACKAGRGRTIPGYFLAMAVSLRDIADARLRMITEERPRDNNGTHAALTGTTESGTAIRGMGSVVVVRIREWLLLDIAGRALFMAPIGNTILFPDVRQVLGSSFRVRAAPRGEDPRKARLGIPDREAQSRRIDRGKQAYGLHDAGGLSRSLRRRLGRENRGKALVPPPRGRFIPISGLFRAGRRGERGRRKQAWPKPGGA